MSNPNKPSDPHAQTDLSLMPFTPDGETPVDSGMSDDLDLPDAGDCGSSDAGIEESTVYTHVQQFILNKVLASMQELLDKHCELTTSIPGKFEIRYSDGFDPMARDLVVLMHSCKAAAIREFPDTDRATITQDAEYVVMKELSGRFSRPSEVAVLLGITNVSVETKIDIDRILAKIPEPIEFDETE